jgi:hypothetical protein
LLTVNEFLEVRKLFINSLFGIAQESLKSTFST